MKPRSLGDTRSVRLNRLVRLLEAVSARLNPLVLRSYFVSHLVITTQILETLMSAYRNKCGVGVFLQGRVEGGVTYRLILLTLHTTYLIDTSFVH